MDKIDTLLVRYLGGTATPEEREVVERWLREPANAESFRRMRAGWAEWGTLRRACRTRDDAYDTAAEWRRVAAREQAPRPIPFPAHRRTARAPGLAWVAAAAALVAGVIAGPILRDRLAPAPGFYAHATASGERGKVTLNDGSTILLGPESEIRVPDRPRRGDREVELRGTAYFDIVTNPRRPFLVTAEGTVTRVLGTRFVVRAYAEDGRVDVAVAEGRVEVHSVEAPTQEAVMLERGEHARAYPGEPARRIEGTDVDALLAWTEGRLVFRDVPVEEVLRELERWYGVEIRVADAQLARGAISLFLEQQSFERAIPMIALALDARYAWDGRQMTLFAQEPGR